MFCPKCGASLPETARFCASCGNPLPASRVQQTTGVSTTPQASAHQANTPQATIPQTNAPQANPAPNQPVKDKKKVRSAGDTLSKYLAIIACVIGIGSFFFLPIVSASVTLLGYGVGIPFTGFNLLFGTTVNAFSETYSVEGSLYGVLFILPLFLALITSIFLRGKARNICLIIFSVLSISAAFILAALFSTHSGVEAGFATYGIKYGMGFWLYTIASFAVLIIAIVSLRLAKKN